MVCYLHLNRSEESHHDASLASDTADLDAVPTLATSEGAPSEHIAEHSQQPLVSAAIANARVDQPENALEERMRKRTR